MKNRRGKKFNPYLKFFLVRFSRGFIFMNYHIRNFMGGFDFAWTKFCELWSNSRKPQNLIHAKINPLKVFLYFLDNI